MSKIANVSKTIRVINSLLKVNYGSQRGSFIAFKKILFLSLARGQRRPETKLLTQEIIKLSNALSWLLRGHRALRKKEEEREIWDDTYGSIHSRTLKLYLWACRRFPYFPLQCRHALTLSSLKESEKCCLASLTHLCKC